MLGLKYTSWGRDGEWNQRRREMMIMEHCNSTEQLTFKRTYLPLHSCTTTTQFPEGCDTSVRALACNRASRRPSLTLQEQCKKPSTLKIVKRWFRAKRACDHLHVSANRNAARIKCCFALSLTLFNLNLLLSLDFFASLFVVAAWCGAQEKKPSREKKRTLMSFDVVFYIKNSVRETSFFDFFFSLTHSLWYLYYY